jgi:hypothetical protein
MKSKMIIRSGRLNRAALRDLQARAEAALAEHRALNETKRQIWKKLLARLGKGDWVIS